MSKELLDVIDIFENDDFILMNATFSENGRRSSEYSIGLKNEQGDIFKIVTIDEIANI